MTPHPPLTAEARFLYDRCCQRIGRAGTESELYQLATDLLNRLLRRDDDLGYRDQTIAHVRNFFRLQAGRADNRGIESLQHFLEQVILLVVTTRPHVAQPDSTPPSVQESAEALEVPEIERPLSPTAITLVPMPEPVTCNDFETLLGEAIRYRLAAVLGFFQRHNAAVQRGLKPPFLLSPAFADSLDEAVRRIILPVMLASRSLSVLKAGHDWSRIDTREFWEVMARERRLGQLKHIWDAAWDGLRLSRDVRHEHDRTGMPTGRREVWLRKPELLEMRRLLESGDYLLPPLKNEELDFLASLLFDYDRDGMEDAWLKLRQLYEQEMDRRIYQDRARDGALRDSLLECFERFPDRLGEFLAMLCYFTLPKMSVDFLVRFTHNKGTNRSEREAKIPWLMFFLGQDGIEAVRARENEEEAERQRAIELFRARQREAERKAVPAGAVGWK